MNTVCHAAAAAAAARRRRRGRVDWTGGKDDDDIVWLVVGLVDLAVALAGACLVLAILR